MIGYRSSERNDGAVDHQVLVIVIGGQRLERRLPDPGMARSAEALV